MNAPRVAYIAGPMTGLPLFNAPAFDRKAAELRARGLVVHSPAEIARSFGLQLENPRCLEDQGVLLSELVRADLAALAEATELHLLPGWEGSKGTRLEVQFALAMDVLIVPPDSDDVPHPELRAPCWATP